MESIEIRPAATRSELDQACEIWAIVFPEDRSFFQDRLEDDATYVLETTWLVLVNNTIAAAIQIFPYFMHWGSIELKVAGIGNVATLPAYRGRGLAQHILRRQSEYMRAHGYNLSLLLTGINAFYEQTGWRTIPDKELYVEATALPRPASLKSYQIRKYEAADLEQVSRMYDDYNGLLIAPMVRSKAYWQGQAAWKAVEPRHFLVAESAEQLVAYMRYKVDKDNELIILDCGYQASADQAALALLHSALAAEVHGITAVRAELPAGHFLASHLLANGARIVTDTAKMWKPFNLSDTLRKMAPELARRMRITDRNADTELPIVLLFSVGGEETLVRVNEDTVEVVPVTDNLSYSMAFEFSDAEWITLLLKGYEKLENQKRKGSSYLRALFPELPYVFWGVDHF